MKRRAFLTHATAGAAWAASSNAVSPAGTAQISGNGASQPTDDRLKLLFMDRLDVWRTWGHLDFAASPFGRLGDPPQKDFIVKYSLKRSDGSFDVWGFKGADYRPWKVVRARSRDGIHFEDVHTVLERTEGAHWAHICSFSYSPELGRFLFLKNMNAEYGFSMHAFTSADGEHWQEYEHNPVFYEGDRWGALWSPTLQRFVYYGKGIQRYQKRIPELFADARRVVTLRSSPDGFHWTPNVAELDRKNERKTEGSDAGRIVGGPLVPDEFQISPDENDPPDLEFYAGDGFHYEGRYYLLMLNYAASSIPPGMPPVNKNGHGPALDTEWWISRDGVRWDRPFRKIDAGEMFLTHNPMIVDGKFLFHADNGLWAIPEDRITYVSARANAIFDTIQFTSSGRPFHLNARVPGSKYRSYPEQAYIMAELIDDDDHVFSGYEKERCIFQASRDELAIPLQWNGRDGSELKGKRMRIRFHLRSSDIFAVTA
jgi:hypothetical protein